MFGMYTVVIISEGLNQRFSIPVLVTHSSAYFTCISYLADSDNQLIIAPCVPIVRVPEQGKSVDVYFTLKH